MVSYSSSSPQQLHPPSIFSQIVNQDLSGCLRIVSGGTDWLLFLAKGRLSFATNSINPFDRLDRQLSQYSVQAPALVSAVRTQARSQFEPSYTPQAPIPSDYWAIRWLLEQQYLEASQVGQVIEAIAQEVIESLLRVTQGTYELVDQQSLADYVALCQLDLRPLVALCQAQLRQQLQARSLPYSSATDETASYLKSGYAESAPLQNGGRSLETPNMERFRSPYTIACIDDSPVVLQAIHSFLDDSNLTVVMINDPLKALIQIIRCKPDLILLDVGMPNLDGYELCSMLRRHPTFRHTPIVMVTGNTGFIDRAKAKLVGASGYLTKPFTRPDLMKMVFKHLV